LAHFLRQTASEAGLAARLRDAGVQRDRLPQLAADATKQWTGTFNPVEMSEVDFLALYETAF
jgi:alcohol dehydrogenase class IV